MGNEESFTNEYNVMKVCLTCQRGKEDLIVGGPY